jgi:hypothetical protein
MKLLVGLAISSSLLLSHSSAFAIGLIGKVAASSCEITSPFKLLPGETAVLESRGYRVRIKRSEFKQQRFSQANTSMWDMYDIKDSSRQVGDLHLHATIAISSAPGASLVDLRSFSLELTRPNYVSTIAIGHTTPSYLSHDTTETNVADFSGFPACVEAAN